MNVTIMILPANYHRWPETPVRRSPTAADSSTENQQSGTAGKSAAPADQKRRRSPAVVEHTGPVTDEARRMAGSIARLPRGAETTSGRLRLRMACRRAGQTAQAGRSCSDASRRFDVNVAEQPTTVVPSHPEASTSGTFLMHKKTPALITEQALKQVCMTTSGCFTQRCVHGV